MKKDRVINPEIVSEVASLGHTEYLCIADCGLPIPKGVRVVDVSVTAGIPSFLDVVGAVQDELVIESILLAEEIRRKNEDVLTKMLALLGDVEVQYISHNELKKRTECAKCIIRTGEQSPYANVIFVGGVTF